MHAAKSCPLSECYGQVPFAFVAANSVYGTGDIETMLRKAGKGYVLGVAVNHVFRSWGKKQLIGAPPPRSHRALPRALGGVCRPVKGPRDHACTTGPISNSPTSMMSRNTTAHSRGSAREVC